jgi:hypothetical protein
MNLAENRSERSHAHGRRQPEFRRVAPGHDADSDCGDEQRLLPSCTLPLLAEESYPIRKCAFWRKRARSQ